MKIDPKLMEAAGVAAPRVGPLVELARAQLEADAERRQRKSNLAYAKLEAKAAGRAMRVIRANLRKGVKDA